MKVAVTGASGFIGRYVLSELSKYEVDVTAVVRDTDGLLGINESVRVIEMDIGDSMSCSFEKLGAPDMLIHLAWGGLPNYQSLHHFEMEGTKQYTFLKNMVEGGLPSLLVTGTCFEYGMQAGALSESMLCKPVSTYAFAKDSLRVQLEFLKKKMNFNLTWMRLFYMYGERQSEGSLYSQLKDAVYRGDETFNMSGGEQLRDYMPVMKVAEEIVQLAMKECDAGVINICSGTPVSVRRLVEEWLTENQWKINLNLGFYPYPVHEPMAFWGNRTYLDSLLEQE